MQTQTISQDNNSNNGMSAIERALAAAKARKAMKASADGVETPETAAAPQPKAPKAPKAKVEKPTDEAREAARLKRDAERVERLNAKAAKAAAEDAAKAARKAERAAAKAANLAEKEASKETKKPAHMKKVEKARAKCPALGGTAEALFGEITANLSAQQIDAIAQHLIVHNRAMATIRATQVAQLPLGSTVRITGGEPRFIGLTGKVVHSQKLRAKVAVPGIAKPVYIYNGQAEAEAVAESDSAVAV